MGGHRSCTHVKRIRSTASAPPPSKASTKRMVGERMEEEEELGRRGRSGEEGG